MTFSTPSPILSFALKKLLTLYCIQYSTYSHSYLTFKVKSLFIKYAVGNAVSLIGMIAFIVIVVMGLLVSPLDTVEVNCGTDLRMGQYLCFEHLQIDPKTQQLVGCTQENKAKSE